jgi:hypothetical protein
VEAEEGVVDVASAFGHPGGDLVFGEFLLRFGFGEADEFLLGGRVGDEDGFVGLLFQAFGGGAVVVVFVGALHLLMGEYI